MRPAVLVFLPLFFAALPGARSRPPSAPRPATFPTSVDSAIRWNGYHPVESDGAVISFVGRSNQGSTASRIETSKIEPNITLYNDETEGERSTMTTPEHAPQTTELSSEDSVEGEALTNWSIAWYLTLLAAFIVFFVLIGLMEICCRRKSCFPICCEPERTNRSRVGPGLDTGSAADPVGGPPPPYELFKPPSYDTLFPAEVPVLPEKKPEVAGASPPADNLVYIINVHSGRGVS